LFCAWGKAETQFPQEHRVKATYLLVARKQRREGRPRDENYLSKVINHLPTSSKKKPHPNHPFIYELISGSIR
jgi:hypothetical protein